MQEASNKGLLIGVVAAAVLIFGGLVWAIISAPTSIPPANGELTFVDTNDPFIGPENASTVVRLYSDFQCPACRAAEGAVNYAIEKYKDKVKFIWKDFPLMSIHPNARLAANAGRCAQDQGKFWEMKEKLYGGQSSWETTRDPSADFKAYALQLGMNADTFNTCLNNRTNDAKVMASYQEGVRNNVDRTPTVFIDTERRFSLTEAEWDQLLANRP
jgi:protein-disulfide isomerase